MHRITKVYTRTGDEGNTGLGGGQRVPKDSLRIEAFGTVDELNAIEITDADSADQISIRVEWQKLSKEEKIEVITHKLNEILENMIRKNPEQWIWTHNRWK